jgi:2-polyprenyl-3-methyl-5-hydroxy-6-metoxy-1,4-benzoquinol methylase
MLYDPIKDFLGDLFGRSAGLQKLFFRILHLVFLRSWYVRREVDRILGDHPAAGPLHVLDAGTGFGQYSYYVARRFPGARVTAVDIKEDYLDRAANFVRQTPESSRIHFEVDDLTRLKAEGPFDFILSVDVMEHIEDDVTVFRHFERVLKPGGHVLINTPSDLGGSDVSSEEESSFIGEHVRDGYNLDDLQARLRSAGLEPVRAFYTYGPYGSFAWRLLIKRPMQMLNRTKLSLILLPLYYLPVLPLGMALHALDLRHENRSGTGVIVVAKKPG